MSDLLTAFGITPAIGSKLFWEDLENSRTEGEAVTTAAPMISNQTMPIKAGLSESYKSFFQGNTLTSPQVIYEISGQFSGSYTMPLASNSYLIHLINGSHSFQRTNNPSISNRVFYFGEANEFAVTKAYPAALIVGHLGTGGAFGNKLFEAGPERKSEYAIRSLTVDDSTISASRKSILSVLESEYRDAELDESDKERADAAFSDAKQFANEFLADTHPEISISEDGIVSFNWKSDEEGVLLNFFGDHSVSVSLKRAGESYGMNYVIVDLGGPLPEHTLQRIVAIERAAY